MKSNEKEEKINHSKLNLLKLRIYNAERENTKKIKKISDADMTLKVRKMIEVQVDNDN